MRSMTSTVSVATSATSTTLTTSMTSPPSPGDLPPPSLVQRQHRQHSLQHDQSLDPKSLHTPQHQHQHQRHQDSDSADGNSDDRSDIDDGDGVDGMRSGSKRKRPISVSCELCKQRKVKCDRGQPACGWCTRNGASCEYKERKKPGLRAGYGRELEARLDKLEAILRKHSEVLHVALDASGQPAAVVPATIASLSQYQIQNAAAALNGGRGGRPASSVGGSLASEDRATPQDHHAAASSSLFGRGDITAAPTPQAEAALFLQKPLASSSSSSTFPASHPSANGNGPSNIPGLPGHGMSSPGAGTASTSTGAYSQTNGSAMAGISPSHHSQPSPLSTPAAREYYGASAPAAGAAATSPMMGLAAAAGNPHTGPDQDLPPYDLTYALVDLYFKHINTWCPLLQRNPTIEALFGPTMTDETNKILLHAIVATTLRYSTDSRLTDEKRQRYHAISKNRVLLYGMENSSVKALQAMVILALDFCGSSNGPPGWNIMALITRAVVQLGLAVESNSLSVSPSYASIYTLRAMILPEPVDFIEEESRRRLFWVIYLLDRYATIATAFEFALDDREIDRRLPCRDDLWAKNQKVETRLFHTDYTPGGINEGPGSLGANGFEPEAGGPSGSNGKPENLGAFSYYIEILGILTKIHNFLKQPVDISSLSDVEQWQMRYRELDQTLNSWKVGLPGEYGNMAKLFQPNCAKVINCGWIMLHITYHTAIIRLHSSSAYPTTRSPIFTPSYSASQRCHTAVENIGSLCEFVVSNNLLPKLGPPFAFSLWVAARLYLVHGSTVEHKLSARVYYFVDTLRAMGRYWPVASRYSLLLQRVLDEHRESERQGDGVTPGSVKILADMRRTAFDLDLLIGRQPRHVSGSSTYSTGHYSHYAQENGAHHGHNGGGLGGQAGSHGFRGHSASRFPAHTPARTPQPNDLEYLDVFDFFNVPRLPYGLPTEMNDNGINIVSGIDDSSAEHSRNGTSAQDTTIAAGSVSATSSSATGTGTGTGTGTADASHKRSNAVPSPPETTAPTTTTPAMAADNSSSGNGNGNGNGNGAGSRHPANAGTPSFGNEFNITDFMIDANRDWLYKHDGGSKFLA